MKCILAAITAFVMVLGFAGSAAFAADGMRTVWVLSDKPEALTLEFNGHAIDHFDQSWQRTGMGFMTQISFPADYASKYDVLRLIRADQRGWSRWEPADMAYLRHSNVGRNDPACVGGTAWCAVRGL